MTYLDMLNNFYDFCECNVVSGNAQLLFHTLLVRLGTMVLSH